MYIICDIDNTISFVPPARQKILDEGNVDWSIFYQMNFSFDKPIINTLLLLQTLSWNYDIIFYTSRILTPKMEDTIRKWLDFYVDKTIYKISDIQIIGRQPEDQRPDWECKISQIIEIKPYILNKILFVIDDDQRICEEWKKLNVNTLQIRAI